MSVKNARTMTTGQAGSRPLLRAVAFASVVAMSAAACTTNAASPGAAGAVGSGVAGAPADDRTGGADGSLTPVDGSTPPTAAPSVQAGIISNAEGDPVEAPVLPAGFAIDGDARQSVDADGVITTTGDVVVTTTSGSIDLPDASIIEQPDGTVTTVASVPLPTSGPLANARPTAVPKGRIGTATGAELAGTVPHLHAETVYTYVLFRGAMSLDTGVDSGPSSMPLLDHFSVFGQEPGLVVIDPDDYFYIGGTCPGGGTSDKENGTPPGASSRSGAEVKAADFDPVVFSLEPAEVAVPCGFGISNLGLIPAVPELASAEVPPTQMGAHVVVHGAEVVAPGLAVDGTFYFQLLDPGFRLIANGTLLASLSVISNKLGIDIPLGDATLDMGVSSNGLRVRFVAETPSLDELLLPVVIDFLGADGKIRTEGAFDFAIGADGAPSIGPDSYLQIAGEARHADRRARRRGGRRAVSDACRRTRPPRPERIPGVRHDERFADPGHRHQCRCRRRRLRLVQRSG